LVTEKLPRLAAHLRQFEVDLSLFALSWFLTCFVDVMPHQIYLPIFDDFLYEGNKSLFRFALAILKMCEPAVLQSKTVSMVHACLSRPRQFVTDYRTLAQVGFSKLYQAYNSSLKATIPREKTLSIQTIPSGAIDQIQPPNVGFSS
uniref:Rab-GAP TBC domain-containing protein n=1 Tax=Heligmosomoides polygyrus TaxID=6339 RepID=A0A183FZT0_HELPZ